MNSKSIFSNEYKTTESTEVDFGDQERVDASETNITTLRKRERENDAIDPENPLYNIDKPRRVIIRAKAIHD